MNELDTIKLLKECVSGAKMGIESFEVVNKYIKDEVLRNIINQAKLDHQEILNKCEEQLNIYSSEGKEPNLIVSEMSKLKIKIELTFNDNDSKVASIMTDGCNMGIKSLSTFKNKYKDADKKALDLCNNLIYKEEILAINLRKYL